LALPKAYTGEEKILFSEWTMEMCRWLRTHLIPEDRWTGIMCMNLKGSASQWLNLQELRMATGQRGPFAGWQAFTQEMRTQFEPTDITQVARSELRNLRQTGTAHDYIMKFQKIVFRIPDITEPEMYSHFVNGLKSYLKDKIVPFVGQTTAEAIAAAERIESVQVRSYDGPRNRRWTKKRTDKPSGPPKVSNVKTSGSGPRKPAKKKDERGPVKCWNCGKEGHLKRDCKVKTKGN
jgi:hypothetical protein